MNSTQLPPDYVSVGGDFARVLDPNDYLSMINALDEASVILRSHLILEEFLNIWAARVTGTDDLFAGTFVAFKTKLVISENLGFDKSIGAVLNRVNEIRNRYSHRRTYSVESNALEALRDSVNKLPCEPPMLPIEQFELQLEGTDQHGIRRNILHRWDATDAKKKIAFIQIVLVFKVIYWMQQAFRTRDIHYDLIVMPAHSPFSPGAA